MSNRIFRSLVGQAISELRAYFETTKELYWDSDLGRLMHPGEYGTHREAVVARLLRLFLPQKYEVGSGFIITNTGSISTQCDIIIYDRTSTPVLENMESQRFFPVETVVGVGEIKSTIKSPGELRSILDKMARTKLLRELVKDPDPNHQILKSPYAPTLNPFDQLFTFVFAYDIDFKISESNILNYPSEINCRHWHNAIVGIKSGVASYKSHSGMTGNLVFPNAGSNPHGLSYMPAVPTDPDRHLQHFLALFANMIVNITTLKIDTVLYMTDDVDEQIK